MTQRAVKQMLLQGAGGSVTTITAALADNPMAGCPASIPMMTKGGLQRDDSQPRERICKEKHPLQCCRTWRCGHSSSSKTHSKDYLKTLSPMGTITDAKDIAEAVVYLTEARHVTGEVLHVDGGAHVGRW